jgi:hypothetical protein
VFLIVVIPVALIVIILKLVAHWEAWHSSEHLWVRWGLRIPPFPQENVEKKIYLLSYLSIKNLTFEVGFLC